MSNENNFDKRLTTAPIYHHTDPNQNLSGVTWHHPVNNLAGQTWNNSTHNTSGQSFYRSHSSQQIDSIWQKWYQQIHNIISATDYTGNPSMCLNSDFFWNTGTTTPITQADGDGAFFSEEWQVEGATNANYTLTQTTFDGNDPDNTGSSTYIHVVVTAWNGNDFYFYQRQLGVAFLRRYQSRNLQLSTKIVNNGTTSFALIFEVFFFFDTAFKAYSKSVITVSPGVNFISSLIKTNAIGSDITVGANPYTEFRLRFNDLPTASSDFDLIYIKVEMADIPTALYVDHALERVRIDNS